MRKGKDLYRKERNRAKRLRKYILDGGRELREVYKYGDSCFDTRFEVGFTTKVKWATDETGRIVRSYETAYQRCAPK